MEHRPLKAVDMSGWLHTVFRECQSHTSHCTRADESAFNHIVKVVEYGVRGGLQEPKQREEHSEQDHVGQNKVLTNSLSPL